MNFCKPTIAPAARINKDTLNGVPPNGWPLYESILLNWAIQNMRSELGKECRKLFRKMMTTEFSRYQEDKGQVVPKGWYVWTHQSLANLFFHIELVIHHSRDEFTTEGAWSFDGKILPRLSSVSEALSGPAHIRVGELWAGGDCWWPFVLRPKEYKTAILYKDDPIEQCLPLVAPAVSEAAKKLKEHLIPLFEKAIEKHGKPN